MDGPSSKSLDPGKPEAAPSRWASQVKSGGRKHAFSRLPSAKLCRGAIDLTPEELAEVGGFVETQLLRDFGVGHVRIYQQVPGFENDSRCDKGFGRHSHGCHHGAGQALLGVAELAGIVGHLMPLREALQHQCGRTVDAVTASPLTPCSE